MLNKKKQSCIYNTLARNFSFLLKQLQKSPNKGPYHQQELEGEAHIVSIQDDKTRKKKNLL